MASRPSSGHWFAIAGAPADADALSQEELARDRIRQLLMRYGILFREILENEPAPLGWSRLFRSLRVMEFSGEVIGGHFFAGIPGLQFISPRGPHCRWYLVTVCRPRARFLKGTTTVVPRQQNPEG